MTSSYRHRPRAFFRNFGQVRLVLARRFIGKEVTVAHSRARRIGEYEQVTGRVLTVCLIPYGATREVIVLDVGRGMILGVPLGQVHSITEVAAEAAS